jgi:rod shape determining protein RodA
MHSRFSLPERIAEMHWLMMTVTLLLCAIGIMMMVSAGAGGWTEYARPQAIRLALGVSLMCVLALMPMEWLYRSAYAVYVLGVAVLVAVDIIGHTGMGAQRWLRLFGMNLQPSEFMKLAVILALARYYHGRHAEDIGRFVFLLPPLLMLAVPAALILRQPNLGTTTIMLCIGGMLCFTAGVKLRYFIGAGLSALAAAPVVWHFLHDYQKRRVLTFLDPSEDPLGAGYNILQSMIAIGSGGMFGKGFLQGSQGQLNFLPEKHTDFIFTMYTEEWGFAGGVLLMGLYALFLASCLLITVSSRSMFGSLIASGVGAMMFVHLFINTAMVMGMIPVVGVPLPFLSFGGSIMLSVMMGVGLALNAHIHRDKPLRMGRKEFL